MNPFVDPAAAAPSEPAPIEPAKPTEWVEPTGKGLVRPDFMSAGLTSRSSGQRVEVLSARSGTGRTWALPGGGFESETSSAPVRFQRADAAADGWVDIDPRLVIKSDGTVAPKSMPGSVVLGGEGAAASGLLRWAPGRGRGLEIAAGFAGRLPAPELEGSLARYRDVLPDVDVTVEVRPSGFELLWVVKSRAGLGKLLARQISGRAGLAAAMRLDGLTASPQTDGSVTFSGTSGGPVSEFARPRVWDAEVTRDGEPVNIGPAELTVIKDGVVVPAKGQASGAVELAAVPDGEWLANPAREFPITIDPTYLSGADQAPIFDTYAKENVTTDVSSSAYLAAGMGSDGLKHRTFMNFNTAPFVGKTINSASLALWSDTAGTCTPNGWSAYDSGAASTATRWTAQPTVGTKYATSTQTKGFDAACPDGSVTIDMKAQVQAWASGAATTKGMALKSDNETAYTYYHRFSSSQAATNQPVLRWSYDRAPTTPEEPSLASGVSYIPAGQSTPVLYTADRTPNLEAVVADPDLDTVKATFEASTSNFGSAASTCTTGLVASGTSASCDLGTQLAGDGRYWVRAKAIDQLGLAGGVSPAREIRVAATIPTAPVVSCPAPYSNQSWQPTGPAVAITCTITATGTGYSAPSRITYSVDGNPVYTTVEIPQSADPAVAKTTVTVPATAGGHSIRALTYGPAGLGAATSYYLGWGSVPLLKRPHAPNGRLTVVDRFGIQANGAPQSGTTVPTAKMQWRVAGATGAAGWADVPAGNALTTIQQGGQTQADGVMDASALIGQADASGIVVNGRVPTLLDLRACFTYTGAPQCSTESTVLRVPHAFGDGFPTAEAGPGQMALWTGELQVDDTDAELATPDGALSVSRSHTSFAATPAPQNGVFGPGWVASFDGDDTGAGGAQLYDGTPLDGTLAVIDADGEALVFTTPTGARRTTTTIPTGTYKPADTDTNTAGATLTVSGSGASTTAELKGDDGIVTRFQIRGTIATTPATFTTVEVQEPAVASKTSYSYDTSGRVVAITAALADGVTACAPGTATNGCRLLKITYSTATTATSTTPGDYAGRVQKIVAQVNADADRTLATYEYDSSGRLVEATDARTGLATGYTWTGSGPSLRLATVTPPGQAAFTFGYDTTANKLAKVTRPTPASAGGGTAQLAAYVYEVPTSGTGLPNMPAVTAAWEQAKTPTWGAAVFGPDEPITGITPAGVPSAEAWKRADLSYTDVEGYTINSVGWGAGDWQYTAADYDATGNVVRAFDQRGTRAILTGGVDAGGASLYASLTSYNADIKDGTGTVITPAGTLATDSYGPLQQVISADGSLQMLRTHTKTLYDQGAPNGGINPNSGQPYRLPTTEIVTSEYDDGRANLTHSRSLTGYQPLVAGDVSGWDLGQATSQTADMDLSNSVNAGDITTRTRYDTKGRVIENRQPASTGTDAGTRVTAYYTAATTGSTGCTTKPAWAGMTCKVGPAGQPPGQTMPVTTTTGYTWDLDAATTVDTSGSVTATTTTNFDSKDRPTTSSTTVAGLASSTPVPAVTTAYDNVTGQVTGTTSTAGSIAMTYDTWGRQLTYTNTPAGQPADTATTTYNPIGQVRSVVDNNGQTAYTYDGTDANGQPEYRGVVTAVKVKVTGGTEYTSTGAYDHTGDLVVEKLPGRITRRTTLDTAGKEVGVKYYGQAFDESTGTLVQDQPWLAWTQIYTPLGQLNREWSSGGEAYQPGNLGATASALNRSYGYDRAGRLVFAKERYSNGADIGAEVNCTSRTYTFDANGNRTGQNNIPPDAGGACVTTGGNPVTRAYDVADRPTIGANGSGSYGYDQLGRQLTIPAADAPNPAKGNLSLGYYDTDAAHTITQGTLGSGGTTTAFTLDGASRRLTQTDQTNSGTNTLVRHYTDSGDNPTWSIDTRGTTVTTTRYAELINGDLGLTFTTTGTGTPAAALTLNTPRDNTATTITLPANGTSPTGVSAAGIDSWNDFNEYGIPRQPVSTSPGGVTGVGYGWLGAKQRAVVNGGLTLMGARLYNPTTGLFSSTDPIYGGNVTTFTYPPDPINQSDITGEAFWIPLVVACIRFCYRAYRAGRAVYRGYRAARSARSARRTYVIGRDMNRVRSYASVRGYRTYRPINRYRYAAMNRVRHGWGSRASYNHNRRWVNRVKRRGNSVVDIGRGRYNHNGPYYNMERRHFRNYRHYRRAY